MRHVTVIGTAAMGGRHRSLVRAWPGRSALAVFFHDTLFDPILGFRKRNNFL
jgi:hypothetical protein